MAPMRAEAAGLVPCGQTTNDPATDINESAPCTICHIVVGGNGLIKWGLGIMTVVAITVIFAMAVLYVVSAGDEGMMKTAKSGITAALIGFAIMLSAWLIVNIVLTVLADTTTPGKPLAGLISNGAFNFSCDTASKANSSAPLGVVSGVAAPIAGGGACTDPEILKGKLATGGKVCDGVCRKGKCNFSPIVTAAIEANSGSMDKRLVKSFVCRESDGNPNATNSAGVITSCGLMQVNWNEVPGNTSCTGPTKNLLDPNINIAEGVRVFQRKIAASNPGSYSTSGITSVQMASAAYNCCSNGENPNAPSVSCSTGASWPSLPKWACPINPGAATFNMCKVKDYACDVEACAPLY